MQKYLQQDATVYSSCALHDALLSLTHFHQSLQNRKKRKQASRCCTEMHFKHMEIGKHGEKKDRQHEVEYSRNALWKWRETKNHATT
jgi:ABC-type lipopolysaccharide export system ATPase subunit